MTNKIVIVVFISSLLAYVLLADMVEFHFKRWKERRKVIRNANILLNELKESDAEQGYKSEETAIVELFIELVKSGEVDE